MCVATESESLDGRALLGVWTYLQFDPKSLATHKAKSQCAHSHVSKVKYRYDFEVPQ